jgi:hypothetical protein
VIYFVAPDLQRPSGGVRTIYRCVELLNAAQHPAAVLHSHTGFRCEWFEHDTPIAYPELRLTSDDVLVIPEQLSGKFAAVAPGVPKVVFNQNAYRTFRFLDEKAAAALPDHPDLVAFLTVSEDNRRLLARAFPTVRVCRYHHCIDASLFHPGPSAPERVITTMPRKRRNDYTELLGILERRAVLSGWSIDVVEGRSEREVARAMQRSALFVSLARAEGFGLPAAEALASGCHVIGFHGMGGRELFRPPYAQTIEDGDVAGLARAVEEFVRSYDARADDLRRLGVDAARQVHSVYSPAHATADLVECFSLAKGMPGSPTEVVVRRSHLAGEHWARAQLRRRLHQLARRL